MRELFLSFLDGVYQQHIRLECLGTTDNVLDYGMLRKIRPVCGQEVYNRVVITCRGVWAVFRSHFKINLKFLKVFPGCLI